MTRAAIPNEDTELPPPSLEEMRTTCKLLAKADVGDTRIMASLLSQMNLRYYFDVLKQANQSFSFALVAAAAGVAFFIFAA